MIRLVYSNLTEELVGALVENLQAQRSAPGSSPFDPIHVVVPNRNLATYLKHEIARRTGIAANLEFKYLNQFFAELARAQGHSVVRRQAVRDLLIARFVQDPPEKVAQYLDYALDTDERDRRVYQIADRLSQLFEEYALARPRMIGLWPTQACIENPQYIETEAWQRELWLQTVGPESALEERVTLTHFLATFRHSEAVPKTLHVFGLSYVARLYFRAFDELASGSEVCIYTVNPCMEYWEDVPTGWKLNRRERKRFSPRQAQQPSMLEDEREALFGEDDDPPALRLWGRPGRDNIRLLNTLSDCDFEPRFSDPLVLQDTLLTRFQHDILRRVPVSQGARYEYDDESVVFLACPGIQREIEVVANEIWHLIESTADSEEPVTFNDIAIVLNHAERDVYQARIRSVFTDTHHIPFNMIDVAATGSRRYVEAVTLLLALPFGRFTRTEFLRLLTHPNVLALADEGDRETWIRWCDELNILHGADEADHQDSYIDGPLFHWDQGLQRLALGALMTQEDTAFYGMADGAEIAPFELGTQDVEVAQGLILLARSLISDARFLRVSEFTMSDWLAILGDLITTYLQPTDDQDEFDKMRVLERLEELRKNTVEGPKLSYRFAYDSLLGTLESLEITRGHYLADGVAVSSFLPMRPIPFRVVFVTGMGERYFPRPDLKSPLDLRWAEPSVWDNFSARRQDEYMFLETLMSTRDQFYVSWVSRDPYTGEPLQPSSVIRELRFMLTRHYISPADLELRTRHHPLRRFDPVYGTDESPGAIYQDEAHQERRIATLKEATVALNQSLPSRLSQYAEALPNEDWSTLADALGMIPTPPAAARQFQAMEIPIWAIRRFLRSPLQGSASFYLRLQDDASEDPLDREDELFETPRRLRTKLLREVFLDSLQSDETVESLYERAVRVQEIRGNFPTGLFKHAERRRHLAILRQWAKNLVDLNIDGTELSTFNLGRSGTRGGRIERREPLVLTVQSGGAEVRIGIVGHTRPISVASRCPVTFSASETFGKDWKAEHVHMDGFLEYAVLVAAGEVEGPTFKSLINANRPYDPKRDHKRFGHFTQDNALRWLTVVLEDMLAGVHAYLLPIEAVFRHEMPRNKIPFAQLVDTMKSDTYNRASFTYGPVRHPERFEIAPETAALIRRRFGLYFDLKEMAR